MSILYYSKSKNVSVIIIPTFMRTTELGPTERSTLSDSCSFQIPTQPMPSYKFPSAFNVLFFRLSWAVALRAAYYSVILNPLQRVPAVHSAFSTVRAPTVSLRGDTI